MIRRLLRLVRGVFSPGDGLAERTVKGGMWVAALNVADRLLQLVLMVILANLLGATQIGLYGVALVVMSGVRRFSELGLNQSLIYDREENVDHMLNTAWLLDTGRTLLVFVVLFVIAQPLASLLNAPNAAILIQIIGLAQVCVGLSNPGIIYFQKDLQFHRQFGYIMSGSLVQFGVAIGYALYVEETAMALVLGFVGSSFVRMLASYALHGYRPSVSFDVGAARSMIDYGKWVTANSILYFLYSEGDDLLVSGFLGPTSLAFYQLAYRFSNAPATEVTHVISSVAFPAYSKIQDDTKALREGFHRTLQMTTFLSFPLAMGIFAITPTFVAAFVPDYEEMILTMQILAVFGLMRSAVATFGPVFKATGRPDLIAKFSLFRVSLLAIGLPLVLHQAKTAAGLPFGLTGIEAASLVILGVQIFPLTELDVYYAAKIVGTSYTRILRDVAYPLAGSVGMAAVVLGADRVLTVTPVVEFVVLALVGAVTYGLAVLVLDRLGWGVGRNVRTMVASMAG